MLEIDRGGWIQNTVNTLNITGRNMMKMAIEATYIVTIVWYTITVSSDLVKRPWRG